MTLAEIEAELANLTSDELRRLAMKSWNAFVAKEGQSGFSRECSEDDPALLAALDDATALADTAPGQGLSGAEVRANLSRWISR